MWELGIFYWEHFVGLINFADGSCHIVLRPVDVDKKMDDLLKVPDFLLEKVKSKLNANYIFISGTNVMEIQDRSIRRRAVALIFEQVAEEVTNLLDWFTGMVTQMIRLSDLTISLEKLLENIQSMVFNLNACLKHLYDNGANVAQALNRYLLLSDIIFVYRAEYNIDTTIETVAPRIDFEKQKILDLIKMKTNIKQLPIGGGDVPQKSYLDLLDEAKTKIVSYTDFYNRRQHYHWLNTDQLKWKNLIKTKTVQNLLSPISGKTLQQRYKDTAAEVDSTKVIAFYVEVAETLSMVLDKNSFAIISLFVDYLRTMIVSGSPNNAIRHQRLKDVIVELRNQLNVLNLFRCFMISTLHLECPEQLLLKATVALEPIVNQGFEVLQKQVSEQDLPKLIKYVNMFVKPVNVSAAEKQFDIAVTETEPTEKLKKIIKDIRVASLATTEVGRVLMNI
ncbi:uncharacterized protein LOC126839556 [Adelges cooleyi]|uniref:uncharacterized protein LOC126839556 n=1 Tax=Adelges cooleyi TaxID=133065 RepID=UPI00218050F5|nr:uncharacterized protein LOC126839556 [Adelges cooleyi]